MVLAMRMLVALAASVVAGAAVGVVTGFLKEKQAKGSARRWLLLVVPFAPSVLLSPPALAYAVGLLAGQQIGAAFVGVGLTGGIATGKSTVSRLLVERGAVIVDADKIAREVVLPGRGAYKKIVACFGPDVVNPEDRTIDRAKLGAIIFSDPVQRKRLNACTHKFIVWEMFRQLVHHRLFERKRLVVLDAPLLFETHVLEHFCFPTIVVTCSADSERARLMARDHLNADDAEQRMRSQMPLAAKVAKAHIVLENDGTLNDLVKHADAAFQRTIQLVGA